MAEQFGIAIKAVAMDTTEIGKQIQTQLNNIKGLSIHVDNADVAKIAPKIQKAVQQTKTTVTVDADTTAVTKKIQLAQKSATKTKTNIQVNADTSNVPKQVQKVTKGINPNFSLNLNVDTRQAEQSIGKWEKRFQQSLHTEEQAYQRLEKLVNDYYTLRKQKLSASANGEAIGGISAQLKARTAEISQLEQFISNQGWRNPDKQARLRDKAEDLSNRYGIQLGTSVDKKAQQQATQEINKQKAAYDSLAKSINETNRLEIERLKTIQDSKVQQNIDERLSNETKRQAGLRNYIQARGYTDNVKEAQIENLNQQNQTKLLQAQEQIFSNARNKQEVDQYGAAISQLTGRFERLSTQTEETKQTLNEINKAYQTFQDVSKKGSELLTSKTASSREKLDATNAVYNAQQTLETAIKRGNNQYTVAKKNDPWYQSLISVEERPYSSERQQQLLLNKIHSWLVANTRATKQAREAMSAYYNEVAKGSEGANGRLKITDFDRIRTGMDDINTEMRTMGRLGKSFGDSIGAAIRKFSTWLTASGAVMSVVHNITQSLNELKEIDSTLTEISKTSNLTDTQLKELGSSAFDVASTYGKKANDFLLGEQEMYRAGFTNADEMAELSTLAQAAGDMTADLANDYLIASNAAFGYGGNVEKLNALLDGQNQITNRNAVSMEELANATKTAGSLLANVSGLSEEEMSALLGTGIATSRESGETVARALRSIMMNLQGVAGEGGFEGEVIDADQLKKVEARCHSLGVDLSLLAKVQHTFSEMSSQRNPLN